MAGGLNIFTHSASTITATTHSHTLPGSTKAMSAAAMNAKHATMSFGVAMRRATKPDDAVAHNKPA